MRPNMRHLIWRRGEAAMRLAFSLGRDEDDAGVAAYKRMAPRELCRSERLQSHV
jgi:hypothetical protein